MFHAMNVGGKAIIFTQTFMTNVMTFDFLLFISLVEW